MITTALVSAMLVIWVLAALVAVVNLIKGWNE